MVLGPQGPGRVGRRRFFSGTGRLPGGPSVVPGSHIAGAGAGAPGFAGSGVASPGYGDQAHRRPRGDSARAATPSARREHAAMGVRGRWGHVLEQRERLQHPAEAAKATAEAANTAREQAVRA